MTKDTTIKEFRIDYELIEEYMYGWLVVQFHIAGYTQLVAKNLNRFGMGYRSFYDKLFDLYKK